MMRRLVDLLFTREEQPMGRNGRMRVIIAKFEKEQASKNSKANPHSDRLVKVEASR